MDQVLEALTRTAVVSDGVNREILFVVEDFRRRRRLVCGAIRKVLGTISISLQVGNVDDRMDLEILREVQTVGDSGDDFRDAVGTVEARLQFAASIGCGRETEVGGTEPDFVSNFKNAVTAVLIGILGLTCLSGCHSGSSILNICSELSCIGFD